MPKSVALCYPIGCPLVLFKFKQMGIWCNLNFSPLITLVILKMLSSHMGLTAIVLDSTDEEAVFAYIQRMY
jgi:hypothetical protein